MATYKHESTTTHIIVSDMQPGHCMVEWVRLDSPDGCDSWSCSCTAAEWVRRQRLAALDFVLINP